MIEPGQAEPGLKVETFANSRIKFFIRHQKPLVGALSGSLIER